MSLKPCHSQINTTITFSKTDPECLQCPQIASCQTATQARLNGTLHASQPPAAPKPNPSNAIPKSMNTAAYPPQQPFYRTTYNQTAHNGYNPHPFAGGRPTVLDFDPMPEENESVWTRMLLNSLSAAATAGTQEVSNMFGRYRFRGRRKPPTEG